MLGKSRLVFVFLFCCYFVTNRTVQHTSRELLKTGDKEETSSYRKTTKSKTPGVALGLRSFFRRFFFTTAFMACGVTGIMVLNY